MAQVEISPAPNVAYRKAWRSATGGLCIHRHKKNSAGSGTRELFATHSLLYCGS